SSPDKIPWHSGLLLILLASTGSASGSLSRLGEEEHPFPNGAIVPYEASLSLVCPPEPTWLIDGSPPEKSLDSSLSLSSPPLETRLRIECLSKLSEDRTSYSFVYIQSNISYTQPKRRLQTDFEAEIRMESGEDVSLSCAKSSPEEEGTLHWLRNGIEELSASSNIFRLSNVTQSSAMGCLLRDAKDGSPLAYQETQIRVPPKIQYPSGGSHYQLPGSSFHEICEANTQQIQWLKAPGGPMEEEERLSPSGQLNLASLSQDTHLICRAQNEDGKDDVEIHVLIVKPSEALELHKRLYAYEVSDIKCEASIDPRVFSEVTYAWFVNGTLDTDQTENVYKVPEVDSGNYTCVISTPVDKVFVETLVLPAVALNIDSEFPHTLQVLRKEPYPWVNCSASGEPQPSIQWLWVKSEDASEELPLHSDKGLLKLNASLALDSSVFKCRAENPQGLVERNLTLKVFDP
ncbi:Hemicentin1like, partial [Caligus rogercresseyi]